MTTFNEIETLFIDDKCKQNEDFVSALGKIIPIRNRNDEPFICADILRQPKLESFKFYNANNTKDRKFEFVCNLKASAIVLNLSGKNWINEKIKTEPADLAKAQNNFSTYKGVAYIITCQIGIDEYIIKFGSTRKTMQERLSSYNCGTTRARSNGTCSTTNFKMMQSLVACREGTTFKLYCCFCGDAKSFNLWNTKPQHFQIQAN